MKQLLACIIVTHVLALVAVVWFVTQRGRR